MTNKLMMYDDQLENLSIQEKELVLKILGEISTEGKSDIYNDMLYSDYEEIPVDIETFITDDRFMGNAWKDSEGKLKIYPFWMEQLKKLFPDNINTSVNNFIESGARGLGKSEIAIAISSYLLYRVMCLKNPLEFYHLKPTEKIVFVFMNIKLDLAQEIANSKFQNSIQMSPWFMQRGKISGRTVKIWNPDPSYNIDIKIGSQSSDVIGLPIFLAFFDEISFMKNQDIEKQKAMAMDMIDTAIGGMKTRFIHKGKNPTLLILASSKRSEKSFLEEHMKKKLKSEAENVTIVDKPVWEVKPKGTYSDETFNVAVGNKFLQSQIIPDNDDIEVWRDKGYKIIHPPIDLRADFIDDIDRALCDFAGISSSEISKYINGASVNAIVNKNYQNPFTKDIIETGNAKDDTLQYYHLFDLSKIPQEYKSRPLFIHLDMSISGDMTGIGGVWITRKRVSTDENQAKDLFFRLAFSVSIKAPKGYQISFEKNRNFIYWLKEQGFNIKGITTDTFQSYDTGQTLKAKGYNYEILSVDRVDADHICKPYQYFRSAIYEKRLEMFYSKTLIDEITELERNINTGKVDHPDGYRKDVCDAVCGSIFNASKHAEEFAFDYGEYLDNTIDINTNDQHNMEQITVDFENELKSIFSDIDPSKKAKQMDFGTGPAVDVSGQFISQGIMVW